MPSQAEIRKQLTDRIIEALERGVMPWRKTWTTSRNTGRAANVASGKAYRGLNPLLLEVHAQQHGLRSRWWGTFRQWQELGCRIQKRPADVPSGQWGCQITFYKPCSKTVIDPVTGSEEEERYCLLNTYTVFNADQVVGAERYQATDEPANGNDEPDFQPAEELIEATGAEIRHGGDRAFYSPSGDYIQLPKRDRFSSAGAYYETAIHELAHWTEHASRLNWNRQAEGYAFGELRAEIAACFVAQEIGIPNGEGLENHAAYLQGWLRAMRGDTSFVFRASSQASAAADYLLSFVQQPEEVTVTDGELVPF